MFPRTLRFLTCALRLRQSAARALSRPSTSAVSPTTAPVLRHCTCSPPQLPATTLIGIFGKHLQCHCSHCRKWCEKSMAPDKQHSKNALDWWWNVKVDGPQKSECSAGTLPCCGIAMPYGAFERRVNCSVRRMHG